MAASELKRARCKEELTEDLRKRLETARRAGASRARRIQVPCLVVGLTCLLILATLIYAKDQRDHIRSVFTAGAMLNVVVMLLGTLPSQTRLIQVYAVVFILCLVVLTGVQILVAYSEMLDPSLVAKIGDTVVDRPRWVQYTLIASMFFPGVSLSLGVACYLARLLLRRSPGLIILRGFWKCLAVIFPCAALAQLVRHPIAMATEPPELWKQRWPILLVFLFYTASYFVAAHPEFRADCQARLVRAFGSEDAAAGLAALLGGLPAEQILRAAEQNFRCVPLDRVLDGDMAAGKPDPCLRSLSEPAELHEVDAFLTHSWHDSAEEKWAALQRWREHFREEHGREPRVWIDKYCIDQQNIQESLAGLPIFLAGCRKLVVLPGSTYASRLWCVIELLTFITMGGAVEDIVTVGFQSFAMDWSAFDVSKASCVDPQDTAWLLAVVEGFAGTRARFNKLVMDLFATDMADLPPPSHGAAEPEPGSADGMLKIGHAVRANYV